MGFENGSIIESVHIRGFWRSTLGAIRSTQLYMIYGELGRFPLAIYVKSRMLNYWCRMLNSDNKISYPLEYTMPFY